MITQQGSALEVLGLTLRRAGGLVLDIPELAVPPGETLSVIGPNGAGKSTLLLMLALLQRPTGGAIYVAGELATPSNALRLRRTMAVVFQEPLLLDTTVAENVATGLALRGMPLRARRERVATWLDRFGMTPLAGRTARSLSGGEAHRTSLARAFALDPAVLLLDEPFSSLDAPTRATITADLLAVLRATRTTTILVTHDRDDALAFGDRVAVLIGGRVHQVGPPGEVFGRPASAEIAAFVGVETILPGTVRANVQGVAVVDLGGQQIEAVGTWPDGAHVVACLRPEDVILAPEAGGGLTSARNRWIGRVTRVTPLAGQVRVDLDCGVPLVAVVTYHSAADLGIQPGLVVTASFKASAVHLLPKG